ncbi:acyl-CoA dehydrogenase family protein [Synechococcus elongatus]|uniref:acyl-CoA dehydrogenase family protein n=1 Tax=Synechococcus elongatus TaxID=32046 RepID=UPI000F7E8D0E|nr:acyl-CoA dehydrogenase family protein [Synechococcus elongatus]
MAPRFDLQDLQAWLTAEVQPQAERIDQDPVALAQVLRAMGDRGWLGFSVPACEEGLALSPVEVWQAQAAIASASGALAFLQTQHQSAASFLSKHQPSDRRFSGLSYGRPTVGIGFSHLRRSPSPLQASWHEDHIVLSGELPWLTGWGFFEEFLIAAPLPEGQTLFALIPAQAPEWKVSPLALAAMGTTGTVAAQLIITLPHDRLVTILPATWIRDRDRQGTLSPSAFACGLTRACLGLLTARDADCREVLTAQLGQLEQAIAQSLGQADSREALSLRIQALTLMHRCTQAAVFSAAGAANSLQNPAQRLYREALAFSVLGLTTELRQEYLSAIAG